MSRLDLFNATEDFVLELARDCANDDRGATGDHRAFARKLACDNFWMTNKMETLFVEEYARCMTA